MKSVLSTTLVVFCWILLGGLNPSVAQALAAQPTAAPAGAPSLNWKSCAGQLSGPGAPATSVTAQFERPQDSAEMLQNLKLAFQNDWLLRPDFFDQETLLKFFNGTTVNVKQRENVPPPYVSLIAETDTSVFPKMSVELETTCSVRSFPQPDGRTQTTITVSGHIRIYGRPAPELTLYFIREVLGPETQNAIDKDYAEGGAELPATNKGSVTYTDPAKVKLEGGKIGLIFYFNLPPKPPASFLVGIEANDTVQAIVLADMRHRTQEN